ncbi:hypothetical protein ATK86_0978 [Nocardia fluminea]|uniref:Uncharacterized protein n=2 Tax=Nocardia TaxID=1817 RepID=A0A2N3WYL3_9NOCA|nr:hypothetical protein ATK86_0978 [Nocardia fluminea]
MQVAYTWPRTPPMRLRIPGMNRPLSLNLEVNEYGACSELFIVHGTYNPCAIAC